MYINKLERVIGDDIANISLRQFVDSLYAVSELHPAPVAFNDWLAFVGNGRVGPPFDYKSNEATAELYRGLAEAAERLGRSIPAIQARYTFP